MESAVLNRRFVAIYGESGSGKTTLRLLLQSRIADQAIVVRPLTTIGMADNDRKGQTLRIDDIYHAISGQHRPDRAHQAQARSPRPADRRPGGRGGQARVHRD
jgi:type II secretory pathway predicted ATPase ExeA